MEEENIKVSQKEYFNFMAHKITHDVVEQVDKKLDVMNQRIERLDSKIDTVRSEFQADFNKLETKIDSVAEKLDTKIDRLNTKIDSNFKWLAGIMIAGILVPIALHFLTLPH